MFTEFREKKGGQTFFFFQTITWEFLDCGSDQFSKTKYTNFIKNVLYKKIKPRYIFVSDNFRFGNKREGDVSSLKQFEKVYGYKNF